MPNMILLIIPKGVINTVRLESIPHNIAITTLLIFFVSSIYILHES